ncbi:hypothetical protein [Calidifontibacter indicus]|uniref:hypothetical protein n=1 Tax=Calidifontibacter indicus TaxID=419650 RepID=UPI003D72D18A
MLELLGEAICDAEVPTDGSVRLTFGNGSVVELYDAEWNYESNQINVADLHIMV